MDSVCNICQIKRSNPGEVVCPVCTLRNEPDAKDCTACGHVFPMKTVTVLSDSESEDDDTIFFDSIKLYFEDFVDTVQRDGGQRFLCRFDGITFT